MGLTATTATQPFDISLILKGDMEIKKVRVHTCNQKIEGYIADRCRCRRFVTREKAEEMMDDGYAAKVITSIRTVEIKEPCPICAGLENLKKSCNLCKKTGEALRKKCHAEYGEDIYMRPFLKTPRTATIEEEHIEYAYVKGDRDAIRRIDLYNGLNQAALAQLGAAIIRKTPTGKVIEIIFEGIPEPEDDPKTNTGRKYDWGRSI
jgi:hypothetical protein